VLDHGPTCRSRPAGELVELRADLADARAQAAYGQHSQVGKIREIHQELAGRIHVVLIRQPVGF
jgi:ribosomal protein L29